MGLALDDDVTALARRIAELGAGERSRVFRMSWWSERMLDWAMARPAFKTQLFRFVDVFPAIDGDADVARHLAEYFDGVDVPRLLDFGLDAADRVPFGRAIEARVARRNITRMAEQFIAGRTPADAVERLHQLWRLGSAATCDLLGEKTLVGGEADRYAERVSELLATLAADAARWAPDDHLERDDRGPIARVNVSIKPTALAAHYDPLSAEVGLAEAKARLRPILRQAAALGAFVHIDMEHADVKDLTLRLFREVMSEDEFANQEAGIVIQAYLRDARADLADLIAWSAARPAPITVRLVKGAYWDTETVHAQAEGWPVPVFQDKDETDASFEACVRLLHDNHGTVRAAFGSHNLRSIAYAIGYARSLGIPDTGFEIQMLYGMAEPVHAAIRRMGLRLRVYAPVGELVPGMAYLVRRLLENTSNESFVRHQFAEGRALDELVGPPKAVELPGPPTPVRREPTDSAAPERYEPEPMSEWRRPPVCDDFGRFVAAQAAATTLDVPAVIDGERIMTADTIDSVDPGDRSRVVARSAACTAAHADRAIEAAKRAVHSWATTPPRDRAALLFRTAEQLRGRRRELAALEVFEAGKPWDQADADVCEAIDFCEFYGREILRLDAAAATLADSPPGERNRVTYRGKGITAVIAPWNFPLAIPCGMTVAAIAAGNPTILKPAEQTPGIALRLVEAIEAAGAPPGVIQLLPGYGEDVGVRLVEHPDVAVIAFTGSRAVGLDINARAAVHRTGQRHVKRVITEMGGKNALLIDDDADLDQAVPGAVVSAFGFAGQKCSAASRLIVLDRVYDDVVARLCAMTEELVVGHPSDPAVRVGPVIDADAHARLTDAIARASMQAQVLVQRTDVPSTGWYVGPTVVAVDDPHTPVAVDELFGPVLSVLRANDLDQALALANDTDYALTGGIYSRSPSHIERVAAEMRAGNVYVNRAITGAVVGRQPFGGYGMSGIGSKAGGHDYLMSFLDPRVVTENTVRQGFAAAEDEVR